MILWLSFMLLFVTLIAFLQTLYERKWIIAMFIFLMPPFGVLYWFYDRLRRPPTAPHSAV